MTTQISDIEIEQLTPILKRLVAADANTRGKLQKEGINVLPVDYYSNTPSVEDIERSYEYAESSTPPYLNEHVFKARRMRRILARLSKYAEEFQPSTESDEGTGDRFFWKNPMFSYSDAMAYYCFVRCFRPRIIVEIGSGFSTQVALEAVRRNGFGRIVCVEPYPRDFLVQNPRIKLVRRPAQEIKSAELNSWLSHDRDFLVIDSTHTVKTGSDCSHIYLRLLPKVRRRIMVHCHDIFLPFGMPRDWVLNQQLYWTEQYLLMALLIDSTRAKVLFGSKFHEAFNKKALDQMMGGKYPSGGGSLWFQYSAASKWSYTMGRLRRFVSAARSSLRGLKKTSRL